MPSKMKKYQLDHILSGRSLDGQVRAPDSEISVQDVSLYLAYNAAQCAAEESLRKLTND